MSLLSCASAASAWRGYEYFQEHKVKAIEQISDTQFRGSVAGSYGAAYEVFIDLDHPRKSTCTCPYAAGKRIVCKHKIAMFFSAFPEEAQRYYKEVVEYEREQERLMEEQENRVIACIEGMTCNQLQRALLQVLFDGPEWQYDKFILEYIEYNPFEDEEDEEEWDEE